MLERTDAITKGDLKRIRFVLAYPTVLHLRRKGRTTGHLAGMADDYRDARQQCQEQSMVATQANGDSLEESSFLPLVIRVQNGQNVHSAFNHTTVQKVQQHDLYCSGSPGEWLGMYHSNCDDAHTYVRTLKEGTNSLEQILVRVVVFMTNLTKLSVASKIGRLVNSINWEG